MENLLTPLKTIITSRNDSLQQQNLIEVRQVKQHTGLSYAAIDLPGDALKALRSQPDLDLLTRVLRFLDSSKDRINDFNIRIPGPKAAQIIFVLISEIAPNYWALLAIPSRLKEQRLLLQCLRSVSGIGAITARLRYFLDAGSKTRADEALAAKEIPKTLESLLSLLETLLRKENLISNIWNDVATLNSNSSQKNLHWKEFVSLVGGGRILSLAAEAHQVLSQQSSEIQHASWLGIGNEYSSWLGRNVTYMITDSKTQEPGNLKPLAQLVGRAMSLGYTGKLEYDT
jgi:telomere length regulation protein